MESNNKITRTGWNAAAEDYVKNASYVPQLSNKVVRLLNAQPNEKILDLGCGDGILTAMLKPLCANVLGSDVSPDMIKIAESRGLDAIVMPAQRTAELGAERFDAVFSNAALHWILKTEEDRERTGKGVHYVLKPGGRFVYECGGFGNCAEVVSALVIALLDKGVSLEKIEEAYPWWFATENETRSWLISNGFTIESIEFEHRPTELPKTQTIKDWIALFGSWATNMVCESERDDVLEKAEKAMRMTSRRSEDGVWVVQYMRIRVFAYKSS